MKTKKAKMCWMWTKERCESAFTPPKCPQNTNSKCKLIPKKPKTRKIKAWYEGNILKDNFTITTSKTEANRWFRPMTPCHIVVAEEDLKGRK